MSDEVSALFSVSIYVESMLGLLLLFMWAQNFEIRAVAWWGSAHLLRAGSISLFGLYGQLPDVITIDLANVILLTSFATTWTGTRLYAGRKANRLLLFAGGIVWLLASQLPDFQQSIAMRSLLSAFIIAGYTGPRRLNSGTAPIARPSRVCRRSFCCSPMERCSCSARHSA
jgi:hypothetical protein